MGSDGRAAKDLLSELTGWDVDVKIYVDRLRSVRAAALAAPARAFLFNLSSIDNLISSPFLIAADGVQLFYWTVKYTGAFNKRIVSGLKGGMPQDALDTDRTVLIAEANSGMGEFLAKPGAMEEFAGQIDTRLRRLMEMKDFQSAMRVQSLFSLVLLWTTYETLRNDLQLIGKTHSVTAGTPSLPKVDTDQLAKLKEYRNIIVHRAAVVDDRFVRRVGLQRSGEQLDVNSKLVSHFFNSVAKIGADMLLALDQHINTTP